MHPNPNEETIRALQLHYQERGYSYKLPDPVHRLSDLAISGREYIAAGIVDKKVVESYMNVVYGNSIEELLSIHKLDFNETGAKLINNFCEKISRWFVNDVLFEDDVTLIGRWLNLMEGALKKASNQQIDKANFRVKKLFRLMRVYEDKSCSSHLSRSIDFMSTLRNHILSGYDDYCPRLQEYCDELREVLKAENKI